MYVHVVVFPCINIRTSKFIFTTPIPNLKISHPVPAQALPAYNRKSSAKANVMYIIFSVCMNA